MPTTAGTLRTARALFALVETFGPAVEGEDAVFATDPPTELVPALEVLHTAIRALVTGRKWFGCGSERATAAPRVLDPGAPIPDGITLLCCEGDRGWDRIHPGARIDLQHLFEKPRPGRG